MQHRIKGSRDHPCSRCGVTVMLAPSGQALERQGAFSIICPECFFEHYGGEDIAIAPGAAQEIAEYLMGRLRN